MLPDFGIKYKRQLFSGTGKLAVQDINPEIIQTYKLADKDL